MGLGTRSHNQIWLSFHSCHTVTALPLHAGWVAVSTCHCWSKDCLLTQFCVNYRQSSRAGDLTLPLLHIASLTQWLTRAGGNSEVALSTLPPRALRWEWALAAFTGNWLSNPFSAALPSYQFPSPGLVLPGIFSQINYLSQICLWENLNQQQEDSPWSPWTQQPFPHCCSFSRAGFWSKAGDIHPHTVQAATLVTLYMLLKKSPSILYTWKNPWAGTSTVNTGLCPSLQSIMQQTDEQPTCLSFRIHGTHPTPVSLLPSGCSREGLCLLSLSSSGACTQQAQCAVTGLP